VNRPAPRSGDDRWLLRARDLLTRQADAADPLLQRQLNQRRQHALTSLRRRPPALLSLALAGSFAALLLAVGLARLPLPSRSGDPVAPVAAPALRAETPIEQALTLPEEDLALLAGEVDYTLVEELEFYAWLEQADHDS
jgi:hypothetical protein